MKMDSRSVIYCVFIAAGAWVVVDAFRSVEAKATKGLVAVLALMGSSVVVAGTLRLLVLAQRQEPSLTRETVQILDTLGQLVCGFTGGLIIGGLLVGILTRPRRAKELAGKPQSHRK